MRFELRKLSQVNQNTVAELFCDGIRIAPGIHCTPAEFEEMSRRLAAPSDAILMPVGTQH